MNARNICVGGAAFSAFMLVATGIPWFAAGAIWFVVGAASLAILERLR